MIWKRRFLETKYQKHEGPKSKNYDKRKTQRPKTLSCFLLPQPFYKFQFLCKLLSMAMRNLRPTILILFILFSLLVWPQGSAAQNPQPTAQSSPFDPRFGVVDSFVNTAEANAGGVGWTRVFFRWDVVQPAGSFDWKPTNVPDTLLDAEIAAGREVVAVLIGTPAWATEQQTSTAVPPPEAWGNFVFQIATQYKGRIKHWVIWNQPDVDDPTSPSYTWAGSVEDYAALLKEAYTKIKAVDPAMQVHLAGLTYTWDQERGNRQYLERLLDVITTDPQAPQQNYFFDAVSYHYYYNPVQMVNMLNDARRILDARGLGNKPIWVNETNAPPSDDFIEPTAGPPPFHVTLEEQSAFIIQVYALGLANGAERIAINKMRNEREHPESAAPLGLLRGDNSRRPAFDAFQVVSTYFANTQQAAWQQPGSVVVVTLDRGGQTTTVLWNTTTTPLTFNLGAIAGQAWLVDERGGQQTIAANNGIYTIQLPGAVCSNGAFCFIGGAPRLVVESGSPAQRAAPAPSVVEPTATPAPAPIGTPLPTDTPVPAPPTLTLTPAPTQNLPVVSPTPATPDATANAASSEGNPPPAAALPDPGETPPEAGSLPDPDFDPFALETEAITEPTPTIVPPVSLGSVFRPDRILWMLIIGLVIFTVSYGIQVVIWYRLRR